MSLVLKNATPLLKNYNCNNSSCKATSVTMCCTLFCYLIQAKADTATRMEQMVCALKHGCVPFKLDK